VGAASFHPLRPAASRQMLARRPPRSLVIPAPPCARRPLMPAWVIFTTAPRRLAVRQNKFRMRGAVALTRKDHRAHERPDESIEM
jgi:hypothetical protein